MREVAIIGAGELGGELAHVLARRDVVPIVRLIDEAGRIAEGKALDIMQAAPIERFATSVVGSTEVSAAAGASVIVLADRMRADGAPEEWSGDAATQLLKLLSRSRTDAVIVCAGAAHREVVERGVRELGLDRRRLFGTAPEALAAALRAIVALETDRSPRDVALTVLGVPPSQVVIPWESAVIGGLPIGGLLAEPVRRRIAARVAPLWPPGPYALANAAALAVAGIAGLSHQGITAFVGPDDRAGRRVRAAALPVRLGGMGLAEVVTPALSVHDRVALDTALLL